MRFVIEIADDWLDTLDDLTAQVEAQGGSIPESALEQSIFTQIKEQRKDISDGTIPANLPAMRQIPEPG